jgi:hypothetical protein
MLNLNVWQGRDAQTVFASCYEKIPCCVAVKYRTARGVSWRVFLKLKAEPAHASKTQNNFTGISLQRHAARQLIQSAEIQTAAIRRR